MNSAIVKLVDIYFYILVIFYNKIFIYFIYTKIDDYNMVNFIPLNINEEDSITLILSHVDNALQFLEDQEPKEPRVNINCNY